MRIRNISIKGRIGLTMVFLAALLLLTGALGLLGMSRANDAYRDTADNRLPGTAYIGTAEIFAARARLALDRAAFTIGTPEATQTIKRARALYDTSESAWQRFLALPRGADEDRLAQAVQRARVAYTAALDRFAEVIAANDGTSLAADVSALQVSYNGMSSASEALRNYQAEQATRGARAIQSSFDTFRLVTALALAGGLFAALAAYLVLRNAIGKPLADALAHFEAIATGELRNPVTIAVDDEMGQVLGGIARMKASLSQTVRAVRQGSEAIATATRQIAAGNLDLSARTEQQASALQQTASSMAALSDTVKQNAQTVRQASALSGSAAEIAGRGSEVVERVVATMGDINRSSTEIAEIITLIEGIAFQTNILALNAAVEAARAGEQGRGFAVVAGEVRTLAQRSSAAAKEIKALIDASVARAAAGGELVGQAGHTMSEISEAVRRVKDLMGEIAAATEDQSRGIDQVAHAVAQMDQVTQQNAALVEEAAAAAQSLEGQAAGLNQTVSVFQVDSVAAAGSPRSASDGSRPVPEQRARLAPATPEALGWQAS